MWKYTDIQAVEHAKHTVGTGGKKTRPTKVSKYFVGWVVYMNNLNYLARIICSVGLFPRLTEDAKHIEALDAFHKALMDGNRESKATCGRYVKQIASQDILGLARTELATVVSKIHQQAQLKNKTMLLPLLR